MQEKNNESDTEELVQTADEKLDTGREGQHDKNNCELCQVFHQHQQKYRKARIEYQKPVPDNVVCYAADMQKVIVLPKLTTKEHVFVSRLVTFNETFASKSPGYPSYCVLWHEEISGREASDVASAFIKVIKKSGCPANIWFWLDNCKGQGKNWYLFTAIIQCLNTWCTTKSITLKYLHKGHTFMAADGVHGDIGKVMKITPKIGDFDAFARICSNSSENTDALTLDFQDIYKFSNMVTLVEIQFRKGSQAMYVKSDFNDVDHKEIHFLKESFVRSKHHLSFPQKEA